MARILYRFDGTNWVEMSRVELPAGPGPAVIADSMAPVQHHCDGRTYDSKSAFRRTTKAFGCQELGNDQRQEAKVDIDVKAALLQAWDQLESAKRR